MQSFIFIFFFLLRPRYHIGAHFRQKKFHLLSPFLKPNLPAPLCFFLTVLCQYMQKNFARFSSTATMNPPTPRNFPNACSNSFSASRTSP